MDAAKGKRSELWGRRRLVTIRQLLAHGGFVATVSAPGAGTLRVTWTYKRSTVVAKVTRRFNQAGRVKLKVALTRKGRALLKRSRTLKLKATATFVPKGGRPQSKSKTLAL